MSAAHITVIASVTRRGLVANRSLPAMAEMVAQKKRGAAAGSNS
jgi:hypothetical protein